MEKTSSSSNPPHRPPLRGTTVGQRAVEAILNAGFNLHRFHKLEGAPSYQTLMNWKTGENDPSRHNCGIVAKLTGYSRDEIEAVATQRKSSSGDRLACPYAAWAEFERTPQFAEASEPVLRQIARLRWEAGYEPSVSDYLAALSVMSRKATV